MGRATHYADDSYYSRKRLGEAIALTKHDRYYQADMEAANAVFLKRLYEEHKRAGR